MEIVEKYPDKDWDWDNISGNPNITMGFIEKYSDKPWKWAKISRLDFSKEREQFLLDKHRQYIKDHLKEELAMVAYHPLNIEKYMSMGYDIEELDDVI